MTKRKASVALDTGNESNQSSSTQDNNSNSTSATNTTTGTTNNNNQSNQNGTSSVMNNNNTNNSNGRQQIGGHNSGNNSNNQQNQKNKKERADNWSSAEIQVLHRGIETRRDIFYGTPTQASKKNRELAWEAITKEVNSVSTTPRSLSQVMKKFKNEKCRAKRKFIDSDKDGHNNSNSNNNINSNNVITNNNNNTTNNSNTNMGAQNHSNNNQQQQQLQSQQPQTHHMTTNETMSSQPSSINVVKLAPQNVAKTMIDLPGHVQHIQMPNDDMVLIVQPEMDGLISGMNIVSDGNSHHFQKCSNSKYCYF